MDMRTKVVSEQIESKNAGYSLLQISLHWVIAALVIFQLFFGDSMTHALDAVAEGTTASAFDVQFASLHYWFGIAILALVGVRLIVRITQGVPPTAVSTPRWSDLAARIAHGLFYFLLVAVPVTGLLGYYVEGPFGDIHAWAKPVFIGLIAIHGMAALYHQFWVKDGILTRMLKPQS
jgi:cytochrome b561